MKETALLHSMAMLLQEMLEKKEISETIFKKNINEMQRHVNRRRVSLYKKLERYEKLAKTLESLYCLDYQVKPLAY